MFDRSFVIRLCIGVAVVAAIYFFFIQKPRQASNHQEQHARREFPRHPRPPQEPRSDSDAAASGQVICETQYYADWTEPRLAACAVQMRNGYPLPDSRCTPGGVNPSVTESVLRDPSWRTKTVRNCASSEAQKHVAYRWYDIDKPRVNSNQNQVCELDHLVPLELGGADGLGNIWPQCGPDEVTLKQRYFKQKDHVENYLAEEVKSGRMSLAEAQRGIAKDWTQYLNDADLWCGRTGRC